MRKILTLVVLSMGWFFAAAQCPEFLNVDSSVCKGTVNISVDASVLKTQLCGDSITVTFDATGTALAGDTNVYMHSGPQFTPFSGWQGNYTVGHFNLNDGIGRMTPDSNNKWSITINPRTYFNYPLDSCLDGFYMVFRNYNGTLVDNNGGNNFFIYTRPGTPSSNYAFITATETHNNNVTFLWSDGNTDSSRVFTSAGSYTVTATGVGGCSATGTVLIKIAHAPVSLGNDTVKCTPGTVVLLNAGSGFVSYKFMDGGLQSSPIYGTVNTGCFSVVAVDSAGCSSSASVSIENSQVNNLSIPDSLNTCPGGHVTIDASQNVNLYGDSVTIVFDATGTPLDTATKVYFYSGPEFHNGSGYAAGHIIGTFGVDNGVGKMTSLGNKKWEITINPYCYYNVNPDTPIYAILMVFDNANGSAQDPSANNSFQVNLSTYPPTSSFQAVTATRKATLPLTYSWSNNTTGPSQTFTSSGTYTVTLADNSGCSKSASVVVSFSGTPPINLGPDTTICAGGQVTMNAPAGYAHYIWSNDSTSTSITVTATGNYSVTATDSIGCQSTGSRNVTLSNHQVSLGNDIFQCTKSPVTINATAGFKTYQWLGGIAGNNSSYTASKPGPYWVAATDNAGCVSYDTVDVHFSDVLNLSLPDTANNCPGNLVSLSSSTSIEQSGDSLVIIYDATQGETGLVGAHKVYFHSGPQFYVGGPWVGAYTVGHFNLDDGLGEMDSISPNHWKITIDPYDYYNINPDTPLTGIYMVFRNYNGTLTGKDQTGNNIYVSLTGPVPTSPFNGVYAFHQSAGNITYSWSDGNTAPSIAVSTPGVYSVTATDGHGCSASDSETVIFTSNITVSLGHDTTICAGQNLVLKADSGFSTYQWSVAGDSTQTLTVSSAGTYSITVADGNCSASASVNVSQHGNVVTINNGAPIVRCTTAPVTLSASGGFSSYLWFGKGTSSQTYSATGEGLYWVKAVDNIGCTSYDTVSVSNSPVLSLSIPDSSVSCGSNALNLDASTSINAHGDSLTITYNATLGVSGLTGSPKVYMHSGPQTSPAGGWDGSFTVGTWGIDNGIGEMTSLGGNQWAITIDPRNYYGVPADTPIDGIWMVFRNADGSQTGKAYTDTNILLNLLTAAPTSDFTGVTGIRKAAAGLTYGWTGGISTPAISITTSGTYTVTVTDQNSCSASASIVVVEGQTPVVSLPADTTVCPGSGTTDVDAGAGYSTYAWSTGASTEILYVSDTGTYTLTVTNTGGCSATASMIVTSGGPHPSLPADTTLCSTITLDAGSGYSSYNWSTGASTETLTITSLGTYSVTITNSAGCQGYASVIVDSCSSVVVGCGSPTANFTVASVSPFNQVTFTDNSHIAKTESYVWNFGDGDTSQQIGSTIHTYALPGDYTVSLTINDSCGGTSSYSLLVDVNFTGIASINGLTNIAVYPNPASLYTNLEINTVSSQTLDVSLVNTIGEIIWARKNQFAAGRNIMPIQTEMLSEGMYWIVLKKDGEQTITKFIVAR